MGILTFNQGTHFVSFAFTYQQFVQRTMQDFAYTIEVLKIYPVAELMVVFIYCVWTNPCFTCKIGLRQTQLAELSA